MPVTPEKIGGSFSMGTTNSATLPYTAEGYQTHNEAYNAVVADTPDHVTLPNGAQVQRVNVRLNTITDVDWDVLVDYGTYDPDTKDSSVIEFDCTAQQQRITQSIATVGTFVPDGETGTNYLGALGVTKDGVEGIDISVAKLSFSHRWTMPASAVTNEWIVGLLNVVAHTNDTQFGAFPPGTVLCQGVAGSQQGKEEWQLTGRFEASPNLTDITIGTIEGIEKKGWQYLECHYEDESDDTAHRMFKRPTQVDVHDVYYSADTAGYLQIPERK